LTVPECQETHKTGAVASKISKLIEKNPFHPDSFNVISLNGATLKSLFFQQEKMKHEIKTSTTSNP
jgi:hypothetical protein